MKSISLIPVLLLCLAETALAMNKPSLQFTHRLRIETWDNAVTLDDQIGQPTCYTRQRSSLSAKLKAVESIELGLKLTHEFRYYLSPKTTPFNRDEVVFDNLYLRFHQVGGVPLSITAGRFNMMLGEGFVVMDPSPLD